MSSRHSSVRNFRLLRVLLSAVLLTSGLAIGLSACDGGGGNRSNDSSANDVGQEAAGQAATPAAADPAADAASSSAGQSTSGSTSEPDCVLIMGWDPWMPYQYRAASGGVTGMDIEIASAAAAAAGCALDTREASWVQHLKALEAGEVNFVGGASRTPAREEFAWFTEPYREESFVLFMAADDDGFKGASLSQVLEGGHVVGTVAGFYYGGAVAELQESGDFDGQFTDADISELNFRALVHGDIDAVLEDPYVGAAILRTEGLDEEVSESPVALSKGEVSFMFSKKGTSREHFERFNAALVNMKQSGALESILRRYRE